MDKHITSMRYATQSYNKAADVALAEIEGTDFSFKFTMANLKDAYQFFLSTLENTMEYTGQQVALQFEAVDLIAAELLPVRADNGVTQERDTSLSQVLAALDHCNAELEKLLEYHQYILDPKVET